MPSHYEQVDEALFTHWLTHVFDHPGEGPEWHWDPEAPYWEAPPTDTALCIAQTFEHSGELLKPYSNAQVNRGLNYIISNGLSDIFVSFADPETPWEYRKSALASFFDLFEQCFAVRCSAELSAGSWSITNPLNSVCYMWWDAIPLCQYQNKDDPHEKDRDLLILDTMRRTLSLDNIACQESALHGLGHWAIGCLDRVRPIINRYLALNPDLPPKLRDYALGARDGCVQ